MTVGSINIIGHDQAFCIANLDSNEVNYTLNKIAADLALQAKNGSKQFDKDGSKQITFGNAGGAVILNLAFPGYPIERKCVFDYGNPKVANQNRISLFLEPGGLFTLSLFDNHQNKYELSVKKSIIANESLEITCLWNKEYGVIALAFNGEVYGKVVQEALYMAPIIGELKFGEGLQGEKGMDLLLQQIKVYSY